LIISKKNEDNSTSPEEKEDEKIKTNEATTSCKRSIPIEIRPYNFSKSRLSERSFKTMIVLLKDMDIPRYKLSINEKLKALDIRYDSSEVLNT